MNYSRFDDIPKRPPIENTEEVVDWFIHNDGWISDLSLKHPDIVPIVRKEIIAFINKCTSRDDFIDGFKNLNNEWRESMLKADAPQFSDDNELIGFNTDDAEAMRESILSAKTRILGYFLLEKYGLHPLDLMRKPDEF